MPSALKLSAMCRAGIQPCEKAFGGPPKRPSTTAKDATDHLTDMTINECRIGLLPGGIFRMPARLTLFIQFIAQSAVDLVSGNEIARIDGSRPMSQKWG